MDTNKSTTWTDDDNYWRTNYAGRPYAGKRDYEFFRPGFQYGFESAQRYRGRDWHDVEKDLEAGWSKWEHRGKNAWHEVKEAARDAWARVTAFEREPVHR
jgi:hypothetical protein